MPPRALLRYTRFDRLLTLRDRLAALLRAHRDDFPPRTRLGVEVMEDRIVPDGRPLPLPTIFVGTGDGPPPLIRGFDVVSGQLTFERLLADPGFAGGVRVATADFSGDGFPDVVTALGPGAGPRIRVLDGKTGQEIGGPVADFMAYDEGFRGGVEVAAADVDGDGVPDVVTAAGAGGGPHVKVFSGRTGAEIRSFFAFEPDFRGGVSVAAADFTGDGRADLAVGAGVGGGPRVRVFDMAAGVQVNGPLGNFFVGDPDARGGVTVGADWKAGDVDADGRADLVVGTGPGTASQVTVYSGRTGATLGQFAPFPADIGAGVRVALAYADDDRFADVVVATGPGVPAEVRVFSGATGTPVALPTASFFPFGPGAVGGLSLAATNDPVVPDMSFPSATPAAPVSGFPATFAVTLTATAGDVPTGTVTFTAVRPDQTTVPLGQATLAAGATTGTATTSVTTAVLPPGSYAVVAAYGGDAVYAALSTTSDVTVEPAPTPWIGADPEPVVRGREVTFWAGANADDWPDYTSVEWDFDYDWSAFQADATDTGNWGAAHTYDTMGSRTVAARVTDAAGTVTTVTRWLDVAPAPPEVTAPDDMTAAAGVAATLAVEASADAGIASVHWWLSSDGEEYYLEPSLTSLSGEYTFEEGGEYDAWVVVTDYHGQTGEGWFHVTAGNATPVALVTLTDPFGAPVGTDGVDEGTTVGFSVADLSIDDLDTTTIYVDWTGGGVFSQLNEAGVDYWYDLGDPDTLRFEHRYDDNSGVGGFQATVRLEDEWGTYDYDPVPLVVRNVAPAVVLSAGDAIATPETFGRLVVGVRTDQNLVQVATDPSNADTAELRYFWKIGPVGGPLAEAVETKGNFYPLPAYDSGAAFDVEAWTEDKDGGKSVVQVFTAVADQGSPDGPGGLGLWNAGTYNGVYGGLYLGEAVGNLPAGADFPGYNEYSYRPRIVVPEQIPGLAYQYYSGDDLSLQYILDPHSMALKTALGATVEYHLLVNVYNVEQFSIGPPNNYLVSSDTVHSTDGTFTVPAVGQDRKVDATGWATFHLNGQQVRTTIYSQVVYETQKSPTTLQFWQETITEAVDTVQGLRDLAYQFGSRAGALIEQINTDYEKVFNALANGMKQALEAFATTLPDTLRAKLVEWLGAANLQKFLAQGVDLADPATWQALLLEYSGLTWDHVYQVVQARLGAGNLAAVEQVAQWFVRPQGGGDFDPNDPRSMFDFIAALPGRVGEGIVNAELNGLADQLMGKVKDKLTAAVAKAGIQLAAKFIPGAGAVLSAFRGLQWVVGNQQQLAGVFTRFLEALDGLSLSEAAATAHVKDKVLLGLKDAVVPLLNLAATQLGLGNLKGELQRLTAYVPLRVDAALRKAVDAVAARTPAAANGTAAVPGGTKGGASAVYDGRIGSAIEVQYQGNTYVLWAASDRLGVKVKIARKDGNVLVGELTAQSMIGNRAKAALAAALTHATNAQRQAKPNPQQPANAATVPALVALHQQLTNALKGVRDAIQAHACTLLGTGCFAAGTKLLTRDGWRAVETIQPGDEVLARSELDPAGEAEWKVVEERFERTDCVLHLHVGDEVIRTTPEHPFFVAGKGWTAAGGLRSGDRLATLSGEWVGVGEVFDTGVFEPVYNLRVADHHTYFVGDAHWGFAVWAHNTYDFISGLKVTEELAGRISLSASDRGDIIHGIRNEGTYGAVGRRDVLVSFLAYELAEASPSPHAAAALSEYLRLACVKTARDKLTAEIGPDRGDKPSRNGASYSSWLDYVRRGLGDSDALNSTMGNAWGRLRTLNAQLTGPARSLHGHHIAVKGEGNSGGSSAAREARDILLYYGINPYWDKANLAYAPNRGHSTQYIDTVRDRLLAVFNANRTDTAGIINVLQFAANGYFDAVYPGVNP